MNSPKLIPHTIHHPIEMVSFWQWDFLAALTLGISLLPFRHLFRVAITIKAIY